MCCDTELPIVEQRAGCSWRQRCCHRHYPPYKRHEIPVVFASSGEQHPLVPVGAISAAGRMTLFYEATFCLSRRLVVAPNLKLHDFTASDFCRFPSVAWHHSGRHHSVTPQGSLLQHPFDPQNSEYINKPMKYIDVSQTLLCRSQGAASGVLEHDLKGLCGPILSSTMMRLYHDRIVGEDRGLSIYHVLLLAIGMNIIVRRAARAPFSCVRRCLVTGSRECTPG